MTAIFLPISWVRCAAMFALAPLVVACGSSNDSSSDFPNDGDASALDANARESDIDGDTAIETSDVVGEAEADVAEDAALLDCTWVRDPGNCWRTFIAAVDGCLHNPIGDSARGALGSDGASCSYPAGGRTIEFAIAAQLDGSDRDDRDFSVSLAGTQCLHYLESASVNGFTAISSSGTLGYHAIGNDVHVDCPDGSHFRGDAANIAKLCGPAILEGGVPGRNVSSSGGEVRFELTGMKDVVFACDAADAGP